MAVFVDFGSLGTLVGMIVDIEAVVVVFEVNNAVVDFGSEAVFVVGFDMFDKHGQVGFERFGAVCIELGLIEGEFDCVFVLWKY